MPRLFIGLDLPDEVDAHLELISGGVPGARWQGRDRLHLTLRFLDECDGGLARALVDALARVHMPGFPLVLRGVGVFPPRGEPTSLWIGVDDPKPLHELRRRIDRALDRLPVPADPRKFAPHVTIARLKAAPIPAVVDFMGAHALLRSAEFAVERFFLYSSIQSPKGAKYRIEAGFPLAPPDP
ncbi:MAG: RNA 2',3'-cyclic phosphodiesterase [Nannocystis sp.]|nr:RNA 2',3'-cyclic phosphodiesterase [Nannocystis sp.]